MHIANAKARKLFPDPPGANHKIGACSNKKLSTKKVGAVLSVKFSASGSGGHIVASATCVTEA